MLRPRSGAAWSRRNPGTPAAAGALGPSTTGTKRTRSSAPDTFYRTCRASGTGPGSAHSYLKRVRARWPLRMMDSSRRTPGSAGQRAGSPQGQLSRDPHHVMEGPRPPLPVFWGPSIQLREGWRLLAGMCHRDAHHSSGPGRGRPGRKRHERSVIRAANSGLRPIHPRISWIRKGSPGMYHRSRH